MCMLDRPSCRSLCGGYRGHARGRCFGGEWGRWRRGGFGLCGRLGDCLEGGGRGGFGRGLGCVCRARGLCLGAGWVWLVGRCLVQGNEWWLRGE